MRDNDIVLYDHSGIKSANAYEILKAFGYAKVKSVYGGITHWIEDGYPIETGAANTIGAQKESIEGAPSIIIDRAEHHFGQIPQFGGIVNTSFTVTNKGSADLKISSISTSCGCASAKLEKLVIKPSESAKLIVFFDPNFHKEPEGLFSRTVFLETNDPANPEAEVKVWVDILEGQ